MIMFTTSVDETVYENHKCMRLLISVIEHAMSMWGGLSSESGLKLCLLEREKYISEWSQQKWNELLQVEIDFKFMGHMKLS